MRIDYEYEVDLRDFKKVKQGQMMSFNGFCKTVKDCIEEGKKIIAKHPEVEDVYFKHMAVFPKLGISVCFRKSSVTFENFDDYQTARVGLRTIWDSRKNK